MGDGMASIDLEHNGHDSITHEAAAESCEEDAESEEEASESSAAASEYIYARPPAASTPELLQRISAGDESLTSLRLSAVQLQANEAALGSALVRAKALQSLSVDATLDVALCVAKALRSNTSLHSLLFMHPGISSEAGVAVVQALKVNRALQSLTLIFNVALEQSAPVADA